MKPNNSITIKNNGKVAIHGLKPGKTMVIGADKKGIPLEILWRRRLKDSKIDGVITVEKNTSTNASSETKISK